MLCILQFLCTAMVSTTLSRSTKQQQQQQQQTIARSLPRWSNIRSSATLTLLVVYIISNNTNRSMYLEKERKLGGIEKLLFLANFIGCIMEYESKS